MKIDDVKRTQKQVRHEKRIYWFKDHISTIILVAIIVVCIISGIAFTINTQSCQRFTKTMNSDFNGGLERVITVYDENGKPIQSWEGKIDVQDSDVSGKILFDLDDKRIIIYNAIVIIEEVEK